MREFRERAQSLLDGLEAEVGRFPDLKAALDNAREELSNADPRPRPAPPNAQGDTSGRAESG